MRKYHPPRCALHGYPEEHHHRQPSANIGRRGLGWKAVGYHKIIEPNGNIMTLATDDKVTNGVAGHNSTSLHVSYIGGKDTR